MRGYAAKKINVMEWIEKPDPIAGPYDAILKPVAVSVCSSDTHFAHGGAGPVDNRIVGHEAIGEIVEVGENVKNFKPGDRVVVPCVTPDWNYPSLQDRNINNGHDIGMMGSFKFLLQRDGVFAEKFTVNNADANLVLMPEDVSIEDALMTTDMMSTGFYAVENADVQYGDTVVVFGIGPVGLMAIAGSALRGAGKIIAVGTRPNCIELAKEYGATDIVSYKEGDVPEQILNKFGQVDKVIIAGGAAESVNQALQICKNNGIVSNIMFHDAADIFSVPAPLWGLGMSDVTVKNGFCPGGAKRIERMLAVIRAGRCHPGKMINKKFEGFEQIEDAFKMMDEKPRDLIKTMVMI